MSTDCKICNSKTERIEKFLRKRASSRFFRRCPYCEFIFLEDRFLVSPEDEFHIYEQHENYIDDPKYIEFFTKFIDAAVFNYMDMDKNNANCLDFGSGPEPVLAALLSRRFNWSVDLFDKFYAPDKVYEGKSYNLVTSTEVVEHLNDPIHYFRLFKELLVPDGILSIMTLFHPANDEDFINWFYINDPSHISFYTPKTMRVIAGLVGLNILYCDDLRCITLSNTCPP